MQTRTVISTLTILDGDLSTYAHQVLLNAGNPAASNFVAAFPPDGETPNYALVQFQGADLSALVNTANTYVFPDLPLGTLLSEIPLIQRDDLFKALNARGIATEAIAIGSDTLLEVVDLVRRTIDPNFALSNFG
jgi:hypothetical protein